MSRKAKFIPEEKEQAVIDYLEGNKSRTQICGELLRLHRSVKMVMVKKIFLNM